METQGRKGAETRSQVVLCVMAFPRLCVEERRAPSEPVARCPQRCYTITMQRLRITFSRGPEVKYVSHLDITRMWERVFRRAGLPLSYSQGFSPHVRMSIAAPLALAVTAGAELLDVELDRRMDPEYALQCIRQQLPPGFGVSEAEEVPAQWRALQTAVRFSEYAATVSTELPPAEIQERLDALMRAESLPRQRLRDREVRRYDLRPLIDRLWVQSHQAGQVVLGMRLQTDQQATGRPDEVLAALDLAESPRTIHRTRLSMV
jgi:radical SAM-linked protein